jgi:thiol-disulfide isomerase/thioredoxin
MRILFAALTAVGLTLASPPASARDFTPYTPASLDRALSSGAPVIIHVHARWCPVCRRQAPILESLLDEPRLSAVQAIRIDYDLDRELAGRLYARHQATVLVMAAGKVVAASVSDTDPDTLRRDILGAF